MSITEKEQEIQNVKNTIKTLIGTIPKSNEDEVYLVELKVNILKNYIKFLKKD